MAGFKLKFPENREFVGGDLLAQTLSALGFKVAFGIHGGHIDPFLLGCSFSGIDLIDTRHETTAVQAAEGYAKISGEVGLTFNTANSGFANGIPGLATAFADRSPIMVITASGAIREAEINAVQEIHDQIVIAKPMTKFCHKVIAAEEIPRIVSHAWRVARSGAPGPVLLDFPVDILFAPPDVKLISWGSIGQDPAVGPAPSPTAVTALLELWKSAKRPVIITGTGAANLTQTNSENLLLKLAEASQTPVFYSSKFASAMPHNHPLRGGPANLLVILHMMQLPRPDLVILIGACTGMYLAARSGAVIPNEDCVIVQVDTDGGEIGRSHAVNLGITSDATEFAKALLELPLSERTVSPERDPEWLQTASYLKTLVHERYGRESKQSVADENGERIHPYHALQGLYEAVKTYHPAVLSDGGESNVWAQDLVESAEASYYMSSTGYLGLLGNGFGYSLGAAIACPDKLILNIQGDGSAGFHLAELDTYARHNLKILTVVMNNYKWGMSRAGQDSAYGTAEPARLISTLSPACRFEAVAEGFGCIGAKCDKADDIPSVVSGVVDSMFSGDAGRAGLINLIVDLEPVTATTTMLLGKPLPGDEKKLVFLPLYENIPRRNIVE